MNQRSKTYKQCARVATQEKGLDMSKLLINESPLQVQPSLAMAIGLNEAIFLQQLHYWIGTSRFVRDGKKWVYNTYSD